MIMAKTSRSKLAYSLEDITLLDELANMEAQESFWAYRRRMNPKMKLGWWQWEVSNVLQQYYEDFIAGLRPKLVIEAPPQHGKLCADHTPVLTTNGWKTHGELVVGDCVYSPSGRAIKVVAISDKAQANVKVEFSNGEVVWCHEKHEWAVFNRNKKKEEVLETTKMLESGKQSGGRPPLYTGQMGKRGCHYVYKLPHVSPILGKQADLPANPYMLGVWLGDGSQTKPVIHHAPSDAAIIDALIELGFEPSAQHTHKDTGVLSTAFYRGDMTKQLRDAGVYAEKYGERKKAIPDAYLTASLNQRLELLAGLIDTDGYTYQKNGRVVFTTADEPLADGFCMLLSTFGWGYSRVVEQPKVSTSGIIGTKPYYVVGFNPTLAIPCRLKRKQNTPSPKAYRVSVTGISVDANSGYIGNCIQVDSEDGLYLVGRTMQPTHNSTIIVQFATWVAGKLPDSKIFYTSFSDRLGIRANLQCQRILDSKAYNSIFPETRLYRKGDDTSTLRNREMLMFCNHEGYFRNTTVGGAITGEGLDLGIVDDPIKGRVAAGSKTIRDKTYDWLTDDFFTRFSENAGMLAILTRWHHDDPIGRLREKGTEGLKVVSYPAISVKNEKYRKVGEPLFPEHKSLGFLLERKAAMANVNWESLYQQNPMIIGGQIIKVECFKFYKVIPPLQYRKIYVDTAQKTKERNDYSVLQCWGKGVDNRIYLLDQIRGKWEAPELERRTKGFWNKHVVCDTFGPPLRKMLVEDKASGTGLIQKIKSEGKIPIDGIERNIDKLTRVMDILGYIESGYVVLPEDAPYINDFIAECEAFTDDDSHLHDDQIDPLIDAIKDMLAGNNLSIWDNL